MHITNIVIISFGLMVLIALMSACCRAFRRAQAIRMADAEIARSRELSRARRANNANRNPNRAVRVAAVATRGRTNMAFQVYEIHLPRRPLPTVSSSLPQSVPPQNHRLPPRARRARRARRPHRPSQPLSLPEPPPPPFTTAIDLPSPPVDYQTIQIDEPPPSYEDYLKEHEAMSRSAASAETNNGRY